MKICKIQAAALRGIFLISVVAWSSSDGGLCAQDAPRQVEPTIRVFDPSGSINTYPTAVNDGGTIAGYFQDVGRGYHGFFRTADGTITIFDPPGAAGVGTLAYSMNPQGDIAGTYWDANTKSHGFVRFADGQFASFQIPNALSTIAVAINSSDAITGYYVDNAGANRGFVRTSDGVLKKFDAPGAGTGVGEGTSPNSSNASGMIAGGYVDASRVTRGFLRMADGTISTFSYPDPISTAGAEPTGINSTGATAGIYWYMQNLYSFVREIDGSYVAFDVPAPGASFVETSATAINDEGDVTGYYLKSITYTGGGTDVRRGFVRNPYGNLTTFSVPDSIGPAECAGGTFPNGINDTRIVIGYCLSMQKQQHAFVADFTPGN